MNITDKYNKLIEDIKERIIFENATKNPIISFDVTGIDHGLIMKDNILNLNFIFSDDDLHYNILEFSILYMNCK